MKTRAAASLSQVTSGATQLLSEWSWLVPADYTALYATAFGDLFLRSPDGAVFYLNTLDAVLIGAAEDEVRLLKNLEDESLRDEVLMPKLAHELSVKLASLAPNECFSIIIPPTLGGALEASNFHVLPLAAHLAALGKIQAQVSRDAPGTKYSVVENGG